MSEQQGSLNKTSNVPGNESAGEMVSELMGLVVAVGLMMGAIIGVLVTQIVMSGEGDMWTGALAGAAIGTVLSWLGIRVATVMAEKTSR